MRKKTTLGVAGLFVVCLVVMLLAQPQAADAGCSRAAPAVSAAGSAKLDSDNVGHPDLEQTMPVIKWRLRIVCWPSISITLEVSDLSDNDQSSEKWEAPGGIGAIEVRLDNGGIDVVD